jgi:hypothetical protein
VGIAGALAAACLLVLLAWPRRDVPGPAPSPPARDLAQQATPRPPDDPAGLPAFLETRRILSGAEPPPFTWPLAETVPFRASARLPADLLD